MTTTVQSPQPPCRNRHCGSRHQPGPDDTADTYCISCADLADDHDHGEHDRDSHEHCPACQP
ncbi:hypothetical protein AB0B04_18905 [Streptomyces xinghaiensis]|uniref:Uncharacterized protein n=2 Tax=Streptomyces TaxID=1883 RepID=A0A3M8EYB4_9ACTN|nr:MULTISPECIES: hypothetical protein [Streptomyces]KNE78792.1 hypothetical protein ADZ36_31265 [Streptomyces fradiae]OFA36651.1 hypothetical protein BEN35_29790 [Streptomyces fradiae]PQM20648.1 hypothetical protein Sfr7A_26040 [Streptomyces xinghaiensis]RKM92588.1 hypothetical protein SFRA_024695 [Streptomyces xinghaiensis]RNC70556.1 hypothetical protein DC095_025685 [Streptomyces xinghaiensis]